VAVINPEGKILNKRVFDSEIVFQERSGFGRALEELQLTIPLEEPILGPAHRILVGFQLTREQLEYNRAAAAAGPRGAVR